MMSRSVAIVTGAGRGIGRAIAEALAARNFDLAVTDLMPEAEGEALLQDLARCGCRARYHSGDIADIATHAAFVERALAEFGHIDCLVNNAGMGAVVRGDLLDLGRQPARHSVPDAGRGQRHALATAYRCAAIGRDDHVSVG